MKIGDYVRINNPSSKNHDEDGLIMKIVDGYLIVRLNKDLSKIRVAQTSVDVHQTVFWIRPYDGALGVFDSTRKTWTANVTRQTAHSFSEPTSYKEHFFRISDQVRIFHNSRAYDGIIRRVEVRKEMVCVEIATEHGVMNIWRQMCEISRILNREKGTEVVELKEKSEIVELELHLKRKSGGTMVQTFKDKETMLEYLDNIVEPANMASMTYREVKRVFGELKPIKVKTVTKFEV